jgi:hypothetical protein
MQHRHKLTRRIDGYPKPQDVGTTPLPRAQLVELDVWEVKIAKDVVVQLGAVFASACQPTRDGGVAMPEHAHHGGDREPFRQRGEHFRNPGRCRFEPLQRCIASRAERGVAGLTAQGLSALVPSIHTVANQSMNVRVGDLVVDTGAIWTGEPLRVNAFGCPTAAFYLAPGRHRWTRWLELWWCCRLLAAGWAIRRRAGLEQPLNSGGKGGVVSPAVLVVSPDPGQPDEHHDAQESKPTRSGQHQRPQSTVSGHSGARPKDRGEPRGCQGISNQEVELSTTERGSTAVPTRMLGAARSSRRVLTRSPGRKSGGIHLPLS